MIVDGWQKIVDRCTLTADRKKLAFGNCRLVVQARRLSSSTGNDICGFGGLKKSTFLQTYKKSNFRLPLCHLSFFISRFPSSIFHLLSIGTFFIQNLTFKIQHNSFTHNSKFITLYFTSHIFQLSTAPSSGILSSFPIKPLAKPCVSCCMALALVWFLPL